MFDILEVFLKDFLKKFAKAPRCKGSVIMLVLLLETTLKGLTYCLQVWYGIPKPQVWRYVTVFIYM